MHLRPAHVLVLADDAMTIIATATFNIECPVHANRCEYRPYSPTANVKGSVLGLCEKCGYQIELSTPFGVTYRNMEEPNHTISVDQFERSRPTS